MAHLQKSTSRFTHCGKCFRKQVVERFTIQQTRAKLRGGLFEIFVGLLLPLRLQRVNPVKQRSRNDDRLAITIARKPQLAHAAFVGRAKKGRDSTLNFVAGGAKEVADFFEKLHVS